MCGIAGVFLRYDEDPKRIQETTDRMINALRFRGPDAQRTWSDKRVGLGCARLAIVGDAQVGMQPLHDKWGGITVFNGEIYEHHDVLKSLGIEPKPEYSDGIALGALLALKGPNGLNGINGMFAGARYEPKEGRLTLIRDAVGKKPLYIKRTPKGIAFASTLHALWEAVGSFELRDNSVPEYLIFRSVGGNHSSFEGIEQLPPGSWLEISKDGTERSGKWYQLPQECWYEPGVEEKRKSSPDAIYDLLNEAVASRFPFNFELPIFLSGGLDSSIVAASFIKQFPEHRVHLLTIGYDVLGDEDETTRARQFAKHVKRELFEIRMVGQDVPKVLKQVVRITEDPVQDPVTAPTLLLAQEAAKYSKVIFTGDGSDETWGGYARFADPPQNMMEYLNRTMIFEPAEIGLQKFPESYLDGIELPNSNLEPLDRILRLEVSNRMRNYHLSRVDKIMMGASVEARCPFLDTRVVTTGLRIPVSVKNNNFQRPKDILLKAFEKDLPVLMQTRKKQPFTVPCRKWFVGELRDYTVQSLTRKDAFLRKFLSPEKYITPIMIKNPTLDSIDDKTAHKIWSLIQLEIWYQEVVLPLSKKNSKALI